MKTNSRRKNYNKIPSLKPIINTYGMTEIFYAMYKHYKKDGESASEKLLLRILIEAENMFPVIDETT